MIGSDEEKVPCGTCGKPGLSGTKRCDWCWEVESRLAEYLTRGRARARVFVLHALWDVSHEIHERFKETEHVEARRPVR